MVLPIFAAVASANFSLPSSLSFNDTTGLLFELSITTLALSISEPLITTFPSESLNVNSPVADKLSTNSLESY